jgi:hypothetical protein
MNASRDKIIAVLMQVVQIPLAPTTVHAKSVTLETARTAPRYKVRFYLLPL